MRILLCLIPLFALSGTVGAIEISSKSTTPAKELFGHIKTPAKMKPQAIGTYNRGCLAGAERLAATGEHWQAMRLSRNRYWGHPELIEFIKRLSETAYKKDGWPGLLVGDLTQPRGGPMLTGHASHQLGMDVDIWLNPMPKKVLSNKEREDISAISMIQSRSEINPKTWTAKHAKLLRRAALDKKVARIFIHPAIKKQMCEWSKGEKGRESWMRKLRPWYGHHYHFHVRLTCPEGSRNCKNQPATPSGDGCDKNLAWWLSDKPYRKAPPKPGEKIPKPREIMLSDLPKECTFVLNGQGDEKKAEVAAKINKVNDKAPPTAGYLN